MNDRVEILVAEIQGALDRIIDLGTDAGNASARGVAGLDSVAECTVVADGVLRDERAGVARLDAAVDSAREPVIAGVESRDAACSGVAGLGTVAVAAVVADQRRARGGRRDLRAAGGSTRSARRLA